MRNGSINLVQERGKHEQLRSLRKQCGPIYGPSNMDSNVANDPGRYLLETVDPLESVELEILGHIQLASKLQAMSSYTFDHYNVSNTNIITG